jgi:hypothetical protein
MLNETELALFTGTEQYHRHWTRRLVYTDGVKYLAEQGSAFWLIDAIASFQALPKVQNNGRLQEFQFWTLTREGIGAVLECREDSGAVPAITQRIPFTDFPLDSVKLYVESGVLLLPSEH